MEDSYDFMILKEVHQTNDNSHILDQREGIQKGESGRTRMETLEKGEQQEWKPRK